MNNLWGFLFQTVTVSLVAAVLLVFKRVFADKLSPRWQYGVWALLALRILIPADAGRQFLLPVGIWTEMWKSSVESNLSSAYSAAYEPLHLYFVVPWLKGQPQSLTDWLFAGYVLGIAVILLWHLYRYVRLRLLLKNGADVTEKTRLGIAAAAEKYTHRMGENASSFGTGRFCLSKCFSKYRLKTCDVVEVRGISSAFVCGIVHPVLVLPADIVTDDKVILHELLHLRYQDVLQNLFWFVLRTLHWCNPFLWYVFNRIGNDMESLCDQRVLERLEGEERREYGKLLLGMVNEKYARTPGTSSVSNGGRQIAGRIESIVRFKKYPRGMALVSVCIGIVLAVPCLIGTAYAQETEQFHPQTEWEWEHMMAFSRLNRCTTMAGAIDTYAKGLIFHNPGYMAIALPLSAQEDISETMEQDGSIRRYVDYAACNLQETQEGQYETVLAFWSPVDILFVPVRVYHEDGWVVEECAGRTTAACEGLDAVDALWYPDEILSGIPAIQESALKTGHGTLRLEWKTIYLTDQLIQDENASSWQGTMSGIWASYSSSDETWRPDAVFDRAEVRAQLQYDYCMLEKMPQNSVGIQYYGRDLNGECYEFPTLGGVDGGGSSSDGSGWLHSRLEEETKGWKSLEMTFGTYYNVIEPIVEPQVLDVQLWWDCQLVERVTMEGISR